jgi:serine/threonine protein phosphatase PrpC
MVRDPALERILLWASPPHILVDELIVAANQAGGQDNISVVVCDILPG